MLAVLTRLTEFELWFIGDVWSLAELRCSKSGMGYPNSCVQGSHTSWKVLDFFLYFPDPGKSWKISLVLERPGNESLRSWKLLENEDPG